MPASDDDREMMARFNDTFRKLKTNREQVPLEVLQTKYGKAYQKLTKEMADLADWFAARLRERMPFPMHPKDIAGNRQLSQQIAAVLAEESQPGNDSDSFTNEGGYWMDSKGEYQGAAFPPHIKGDKIWTRKN